jgi:hypothetical protein
MVRLQAAAPALADLVAEKRLSLAGALGELKERQKRAQETRETATRSRSLALLHADPVNLPLDAWAARLVALVDWQAQPHGFPRTPERLRRAAAAVLYSVGANAAHGVQRSNADKRRAVETLLRDTEWSQSSDREIARRCAVAHSFVLKVRQELSGLRNQIAGRKVARGDTVYRMAPHVGYSQQILPDVRAVLRETPVAANPAQLRQLAALDGTEQRAVAAKIAAGEAPPNR